MMRIGGLVAEETDGCFERGKLSFEMVGVRVKVDLDVASRCERPAPQLLGGTLDSGYRVGCDSTE